MGYGDLPQMVEHFREEEGPVGEVLDTTADWTEARILHVLKIFPKLSVSMLQIGVGTSLAPKLWKPVLHKMFEAGTLIRDVISATTPDGRVQTYTIISIAPPKPKTQV